MLIVLLLMVAVVVAMMFLVLLLPAAAAGAAGCCCCCCCCCCWPCWSKVRMDCGHAAAAAAGCAAGKPAEHKFWLLSTPLWLSLLNPLRRDIRLRQERQQAAAAQREEALKGWDPAKDPNAEVRQ